MMLHARSGISQVQRNTQISLRCPSCRQLGTLDGVIQFDAQTQSDGKPYLTGQRQCPNPLCRAIIYFIWDIQTNALAYSCPPERLYFDATNIPAAITNALEESIACHANECFIASAIMVRKTLEELCHERGATGGNLKERLRQLSAKIIIPKDLLDGLDDLRLLGNDAAHIESREYNTVGREEVEIGIEFTKEVLKDVYQYSALVDKLRSLKRTL